MVMELTSSLAPSGQLHYHGGCDEEAKYNDDDDDNDDDVLH